MRIPRRRHPWTLIAATLVGCMAVAIDGPSEPRFTHDMHAERGLECVDCHGEGEPTLPAVETCRDCHEPGDAADTGGERVVAYGQPGAWRPGRPGSYADVSFAHAKHARYECSRCHDGIGSGLVPTPDGPMSMDACVACHEEANVSASAPPPPACPDEEAAGADVAPVTTFITTHDVSPTATVVSAPVSCGPCHTSLGTSTPPPSHGGDWTRWHGAVTRAGADTEHAQQRCDLCHTDSSCAQCHAGTPPADHTNHFITRGHGARAAVDRDRCRTCHKTDSCETCHALTPPRTHTFAFGAPRQGHCTSCHLPLGEDSCAACHRSISSHNRAPLPPGGVHAASASPGECLMCHTRLQHVDAGYDCRTCHR